MEGWIEEPAGALNPWHGTAPSAGRQFAELFLEGRLLAATGFGTANDFGQTIAVAMLGPSADALALVEPPPAKPKRHPEDRKVREEES